MKKYFRNLFFYGIYVYLLPHILFYHISKNKHLIYKDIKRINEHSRHKCRASNLLARILYERKGYRNIFYNRVGRRKSFFIKWMLKEEKTFACYCSDLGGGIYPAHPYSTVINARKIGANFSCRNSTTIGNKSDYDTGEPDTPIIGNDVTLGANVVIIGNITIGNNVIIGAGSIVVKDVPDNCIVAGNPAKIIKSNFTK